MAALTAARELNRYVDQSIRSFPVKGSTKIWKGGLYCVDANGYLVVPATGLQFVGIAAKSVDNSAGADGAKFCDLFTQGDFEHPLASSTIANVRDAAYVVNGDDSTISTSATSNVYCGEIIGCPVAGTIILRLRGSEQAP